MGTKSGRGRSYEVALAAGLFLAGTGTARAQVSTPIQSTAHIIEWDLTQLPDELDANAAAITVDTRGEDHNQLWFVTRAAFGVDAEGGGQRVYRFVPTPSLMKGNATWSSWGLHLDFTMGGLKRVRPSHDRRFIYVRTNSFVQRVDTQACRPGPTGTTCDRLVWSFPTDDVIPPDNVSFIPVVSDVAVDDANRVFTTGDQNTVAFPGGYVQMVDPSRTATIDPTTGITTTMVKRWADDNGAGQCISSFASTLCNAGIDVHPSKQNLIYFVEIGQDGHGFIAELNVDPKAATTKDSAGNPLSPIRRWSLADLGLKTGDTDIAEPRMLKIDRSGKIWVNTGSGHIISLDPNTNRMTKHRVPGVGTNTSSSSNDLWAVAPDDDVIGYTAANLNKVAMMFPHRAPVVVTPAKSTLPVVDYPAQLDREQSLMTTGTVPGQPKIAPTQITSNQDGLFIEGLVDAETPAGGMSGSAPAMQPLGITPNHAKAQGSFFYTVGAAADPASPDGFSLAKRVAFIRLPMKERPKFGRDDDDTDDGFDRTRDARWHNSEPGDADADGVPDEYDTNTSTDNMTIADPVVVPVGQSNDYPMATSATTLALIAAVTPDVATATIAVDVYNSLGTLVGTSGPIVGAGVATVPTPGAGTYKIRVRNLGTTAVTPTPTIVVREPLIQQ